MFREIAHRDDVNIVGKYEEEEPMIPFNEFYRRLIELSPRVLLPVQGEGTIRLALRKIFHTVLDIEKSLLCSLNSPEQASKYQHSDLTNGKSRYDSGSVDQDTMLSQEQPNLLHWNLFLALCKKLLA